MTVRKRDREIVWKIKKKIYVGQRYSVVNVLQGVLCHHHKRKENIQFYYTLYGI